jgi:hypothetical protein
MAYMLNESYIHGGNYGGEGSGIEGRDSKGPCPTHQAKDLGIASARRKMYL